jgi:hypothetical protein
MSTALFASKVDASTRFGSIVSAALSCQAKQTTAHVSRPLGLTETRSRLTHRHSVPPALQESAQLPRALLKFARRRSSN